MIVVVGLIRTPEGEAALQRAVEEARLRAAKLVVVHSMKGRTHEASAEVFAYREALEAVEQRLRNERIDHEVIELVQGHPPAEDLLAVAEQVQAELIVIGLRRRSLVAKLILGSNAQDVLLGAHCAVLAVKASSE